MQQIWLKILYHLQINLFTLIVILSLIVMAISIGFTVMTTRFVVNSLSKLQQGILGFFSFLNEESKSATLIDLKVMMSLVKLQK